MANRTREDHRLGHECVDASQVSVLSVSSAPAEPGKPTSHTLARPACRFDFLELPGLACIWASYSYTYKTYVRLATPIVVAIFLALPLPVARFCAQRAAATKRNTRAPDVDAPDAAREQEIKWKERYERTIDVFWNNIMVPLK